jgi:hypothetical protein
MYSGLPLRSPAIVDLEILAGKPEQFTIARVIQWLDTSDSCCEAWPVLAQIGSQFLLRTRRPGDQEDPGVQQVFGDMLEKGLVNRRVPAIAGIRLVMDMLVWMAAANGVEFDVRGVELEDSGLLMVDPDNRVIMVAHD